MSEHTIYPQLKLENQICFPLYAVSRKIISLYTPYLKPLGLTYTQYLVLMVLWEKETITVSELCRSLRLDNGTVTPLLKKMEKAGLVSRSRSKSDERVVAVSLTAAGWALEEDAKDIPIQLGKCIPMSKEEAEQLYNTLYQILNCGE
ncbi:MAG: MarR family transcriptional regulator [Eubacterium sp.]|nr:MarR family transcriptional regulator [Eubacterium sp.]